MAKLQNIGDRFGDDKSNTSRTRRGEPEQPNMEDFSRQLAEVQRGLETRAQQDHDLLIELRTTSQFIAKQIQEFSNTTASQIAAADVRHVAAVNALETKLTSSVRELKAEHEGKINSLRIDVDRLINFKFWMLGAAGIIGAVGGVLGVWIKH